jgi:polysaccharide pyruvyl transferase WcaK-like protein
MSRTYHLLVPEYVPLKNRGEEAIIRGIMDVLFPNGNCEIHLFEMEREEYSFQDGIHVYPGNWFFSPWLAREFGLGASWEKIRDSACSLTRNGLHKLWPGWVKRWCRPLSVTAGQMKDLANGHCPVDQKGHQLLRLLDCDYVVAGHDGALDERVCHVIDLMAGLGKACGVFGIDYRPSFRSKAIVEVKRKTLRRCEFFYCRTAGSLEIVNRYLPDVHAELLPDPAFGMSPAPEEAVDRVIAQEGIEAFFSRPVVMCTCCEPSPIARFCFEDVKQPHMKLICHRQLFADLIDYIVREYDVNVLFLPHSLGPGMALDDRRVASDILRRSGLPLERARLLTTECSARELKGLLKRAELLVAERIHSMIGATGVHTAFLCLGSRTDRRIHGIIEEMCGMTDAVYFLNRAVIAELKAKFDDVWQRRAALRQRLAGVAARLSSQLEEAGITMRMCIDRAGRNQMKDGSTRCRAQATDGTAIGTVKRRSSVAEPKVHQ